MTVAFEPTTFRVPEEVVVFDTETTGVSVESARIVTAFAGVMADDGNIVMGQSWTINPGIPIPAAATKVHGITDEHVATAGGRPSMLVRDIAWTLAAYMKGGRSPRPLVAFNAVYDLTLLDREMRRHTGEPLDPAVYSLVVDPLVLDKAHDRYRRGKRTLEVVAALHGVDLGNAHDASSDAIAAGRIAYSMLRGPMITDAEQKSGPVTLERLHGWQRTWKRRQQDSYVDYRIVTEGKTPEEANADVDRRWPLIPYDTPDTPGEEL